MKIIVLGKNGMLGRYVYTYFKHNNYETIGISRKDINITEVDKVKLKQFFQTLELKENDVVINCIGVIKPRVDELGVLNAININSKWSRPAFPLRSKTNFDISINVSV